MSCLMYVFVVHLSLQQKMLDSTVFFARLVKKRDRRPQQQHTHTQQSKTSKRTITLPLIHRSIRTQLQTKHAVAF